MDTLLRLDYDVELMHWSAFFSTNKERCVRMDCISHTCWWRLGLTCVSFGKADYHFCII